MGYTCNGGLNGGQEIIYSMAIQLAAAVSVVRE